MTYPETVEWLYGQLPVYQRQGGAALKKDLTNIRALLTALGDPHLGLRCVHVGGTNGKGTVSHLLAAALQSGGRRVGLYTSPHYIDFRERIRINGDYVSEEFVVTSVEAMRAVIVDIRPSFFEFTVAMAFQYFAEQSVDWAVIEVGLGGRLDSTNVITPRLSVITNISKDHVEFLGNTLPAIATEKAGIIKAGVPVVIGQTHPETEAVFRQKAQAEDAPIHFADRLWSLQRSGFEKGISQLIYTQNGTDHPQIVEVAGRSPHLHLNVRTALTALSVLRSQGVELPTPTGLSEQWRRLPALTGFFGRFQVIGTEPTLIIDSAHNEGGLRDTFEYLAKSVGAGRLHVVLGVVNDKDLTTILPLFPQRAAYYFVNAKIARARPAAELARLAQDHGLRGGVYSSVAAGLAVAFDTAAPADTVYVGGSIFVAAEALAYAE